MVPDAQVPCKPARLSVAANPNTFQCGYIANSFRPQRAMGVRRNYISVLGAITSVVNFVTDKIAGGHDGDPVLKAHRL